MIQDINPHKLHNEYRTDMKPEKKSKIVHIVDGKVLLKPGVIIELPTLELLEEKNDLQNFEIRYLFCVDEEAYFLLRQNIGACECEAVECAKKTEELIVSEGYEYVSVRAIRGKESGPKHCIFAINTAKHLDDWYRDTQFCGRCGQKMEHSETERAMKCPVCGYTAYPRIMPAVIVGVINDEKLLLTKYRTGYRHNALVAGFTEIGETLEETVAREVMEEAGLCVKNIRYYKSQPWGIANDILTGFYCEVDGDTTIHMDTEELKYAEWVQREAIELQPDDFSLTNEMMYQFKTGMIHKL